ncbi:MAG: dienelactone hydrolase family protein [Gammaproteobacteria bacterium]
MQQSDIDAQVFELYDEYCHGHMNRREFLDRAGKLTVAGVSAIAMAEALLPNYADAHEIQFTDKRMKANWIEYPSPGGTSGNMRGYLAAPVGEGPFPAVLVMHENRGLNPYVQDVARRFAVAGFLALAPDGLSPIGGYPGNDDDGRTMQRTLDQAKLRQDMVNSARFVKTHALSNGRLGATGFCWGGGTTNFLATELGAELDAGAPFYGSAAATDQVPKIKAALQVHYAEEDKRVNAMRPEFERALKSADVKYQMHTYPGTRHGFHNYSTPRYDHEAAQLAWDRMTVFFRENLKEK